MGKSLGYLTEGDKAAYGCQEWYRATVHDLGNGHREASITRYRTLSELPEWWGTPDPEKAARGEGNREESIERAARRAKTRVRRQAKVIGVDVLWTLTYRQNVQDRAIVVKHWKEFVRRVRGVIPDFHYVATLERQKRGAWHIHIATRRLPVALQQKHVMVKSYDVLRAIWRSVTKEYEGNFDQSRRKRQSKKNAMQIASYISKYVTKDYAEGDLNKKRYMHSEVGTATKTQTYLFGANQSFGELIALMYQEVAAGPCEIRTHMEAARGMFWISTLEQEPPKKRVRFDLSAHSGN